MTGTIYANSIASYLSGKLLGAEKLRRLSDADFDAAVKMLIEYGYGQAQDEGKNYDVDLFLKAQTKQLIDFVQSDSASVFLARCLLNRFYYSDAKVAFKSKYTGGGEDSALFEADPELISALKEGEYDKLPGQMHEAAAALTEKYADQKPSAKEIDQYFSRAMHKDNLDCAKKSKSKSLMSYCRAQIDIANILSAFRAKQLGMTETELALELFDGGEIPAEQYAEILTGDPAAFAKNFDLPTYEEIARELGETGDVAGFQKKADELLLSVLRDKTENITGFGPFIEYFVEQIIEFKAIKFILVCVKNNLKQELNARLGDYLP